ADVNGDGKLDIVAVNGTYNNGAVLGVLLGKSNGTFQPTMTSELSLRLGPKNVTVADVTRNRIPDAIVNIANTVAILPGNGDGTFRTLKTYPVGSASPVGPIAIEDLNGDGIADLVAVSAYSHSINLLTGQGLGSFGAAQPITWDVFPPSALPS